MKSKNFNSIKPYTYLITRISDGLKYHGVRWENIRLKRIPSLTFKLDHSLERGSNILDKLKSFE